MNMQENSVQTITHTINYPRGKKKYYYLLYAMLIIIDILCIIFLFKFWLIPATVLSISVVIIFFLESDSFIFTPMEMQLSTKSIILKYRFNRIKIMNWSDIVWLNIWPGGDNCYANAQVKFDDGKLYAISLNYEAGRALKEMYCSIFGKKPLNYEEWRKLTNSSEWFSIGPSE